MIEFKNVNLKYVDEFYSLFNFSHIFNKNTLIIGDELGGANSILRLIAKFDKDFSGEIKRITGRKMSEMIANNPEYNSYVRNPKRKFCKSKVR